MPTKKEREARMAALERLKEKQKKEDELYLEERHNRLQNSWPGSEFDKHDSDEVVVKKINQRPPPPTNFIEECIIL